MRSDSLEQLSAAFGRWRAARRHAREKTPEQLVRRACRAAGTYGVAQVSRALKLDRRRLEGAEPARTGRKAEPVVTPSYSRVELVGAASSTRPFAELELPSGIKLRLYSHAAETMTLLSSVCGPGVGR